MKNNYDNFAGENLITYDPKATGERLREIRTRQHLTQEQAGEKLCIERKSLSAIERGATGCSVALFVRIAQVYQVSLDYILLGRKTNLDIIRDLLRKAIELLTFALESLES